MSDEKYRKQGFGARRVGFGQRPAIIVVDFQLGFTDAAFVLGGSPIVDAAVQKTARLLTVARAMNLPVIQAFAASWSTKDALHWKIPAVLADFHVGKPAAELDPRTYDRDYDVVIQKIGPSVLFQTSAISYLVKENVDTVIVTGCNTSGCVRATAVDAFSYGFRVIVAHDCCGDVDERPHQDNLRDMERRYADILSLEEVLNHLNNKPSQQAAE